jgi:uncharacterized protein YuzE
MAKHDKTFLDYDRKNDILYLYKQGKFKGNVEVGDFVLDFDKEKRVMGLEILNASENLRNLGITKQILTQATEAKLKSHQKNSSILISFVLSIAGKETPALIAMPIGR